ncbi:MAG: hypothetical protein M3397_00365 [Actinomycetota bacterium]|nr:hypothetical protein [Actinomycetota bacterium]
MVQVSKSGKMHASRDLRFTLAIALVSWAAGVLVFAVFPADSSGRTLTADYVYVASAVFSLAILGYTVWNVRGRERLFWGLLGAGLLATLLGDIVWEDPHNVKLAIMDPSLVHAAYLVAYLLFAGALLSLVAVTTRRITPIIAFDAMSVMLSVGVLIWYFLLGPAATGPSGSWAALATFSWTLFDVALVFLALVLFSAAGRPPFAALLVLGFLSFAVANGWYLNAHSDGLYDVAGWPDLFWSLGLLFLGSAALWSNPAGLAVRDRIASWQVFAFWLGPLSPPLHLGLLFLWGAFHPPLPAFALVGGAVLMAYLALRVALVSAVTRLLNRDQEEAARKLEQSRILYELHDTVKGRVHGISLALAAALEAERHGERDVARERFGRAMEASRETEFLISKPYDELHALANEIPLRAGDYLRHRLARFEEYFGVKTHADLQAPLESLSPAETAAVTRVAVEAFWNVAKHSKARNMYLESRQVGPILIIRIRDDGRGFDAKDPPPGMGLRYLRQRAAEVGAELDVISDRGRGTTVQIRFEKG